MLDDLYREVTKIIYDNSHSVIFSSDDVRDYVNIDAVLSQNQIGNLFRLLKAEGYIRRYSYKHSARPQAKGRVIATWRWTPKGHNRFNTGQILLEKEVSESE